MPIYRAWLDGVLKHAIEDNPNGKVTAITYVCYMCVCVYVHTCVYCTYIHVYICTSQRQGDCYYIYVLYMCVYVHTCVYMYMHICVYMYICMYVHTYDL